MKLNILLLLLVSNIGVWSIVVRFFLPPIVGFVFLVLPFTLVLDGLVFSLLKVALILGFFAAFSANGFKTAFLALSSF